MAEIVSTLVVNLVGYMAQVGVEKIIAPSFGGRDKLDQLKGTMDFIHARLADAESRREGEDGAAAVKLLLKRLKGVLHKLEDLFEEVSMADVDRARAAETMFITRPVRVLILETRRRMLNYKVSQDVKAILSDLETIKSNMGFLNLREGEVRASEPMKWRETHSYVSEEEVIGRKNDRDVIVDMLLSSHHDQGDQSLSVIPILGIGGLGKTTLAQYCFNDKKVKQRFELKAWICISESSGLKDFVRLIHDALRCGKRHGEKISLEELQSCLREHINGKRFLIVLDDVWTEDRETWLKLKSLLSCGKQGSKILVTTRSIVVGELMGTVEPYQLKALSEEESWALFESLAFDKRPHERDDSRLISIGREIVQKCVNVPLAIRTIASLLRSKHTEEEWVRFRDKELRFIEQNGRGTNAIMSTLKLSYDHLPSHLKQCFAYCSLFPKDYELDKQQLIWLWMAQGFLGQPLGNKNLEDVGDEYFMELLRRCFFQNVKRNEFGMIVGCMMHDLFHDLASEMGDDQLLLIEGHIPDDSIRHLSFVDQTDTLKRDAPFSLHTASQMRSLLYVGSIPFWSISKSTISKSTILSLRHIRALHLTNLIFLSSLPNSIGKLKHLRYLAIGIHSKSLPSGINGLQNLQTLDLLSLHRLRKLPKGFHKLFNLRHLRIRDWNALYGRGFPHLIEMPLKFGELTSLQTLDTFIVGNNNGLDALGGMKNLAGELLVCFRKHRQNFLSEASRANLKGKKLTSLGLKWSLLGDDEVPTVDAEKELECLQPPSGLKELNVEGWKGVRFPGWEKDGSLGCLIYLRIEECKQCRHLPCLNRLPHLKLLKLEGLDALEYIDDEHGVYSSQNAYFPSLEDLELSELPNLKGWSRAENNIGEGARHEEDENHLHLHMFCRLSELRIERCDKLMSMPQAPRLQTLTARNIQGRLLNQLLVTQEKAVAGTSSCVFELKELRIRLVNGLDSLSIDFSNSLQTLCISECRELASLSAESKSSLRNLEVWSCSRLKDITSVLRQLPVLEKLEIIDCDLEKLDLREVGSGCQIGWQGLENLKMLRIESCHKLTSLQYLPCGLTDLEICDCDELASLGLGNLTQLRNLKFEYCPGLKPYIESSFGDHLSCLTMLETLYIRNISYLETLPESIGHLPHLRTLRIWKCPQLRALPASFRNLSGLQLLDIYGCPRLNARCKPRGEDWPLIQHIPYIDIDHREICPRDRPPLKNWMSGCYC